MTRDLTEKQYLAALERRGFKPCGMGRLWVEHPEFPGTMFGAVFNTKTFKIARRASLAKVIKDVDRERARRKAKHNKEYEA